MDKIKVSKEIYEVLLKLKGLGSEDFILKTHARELGFVTPTFDILNKLSTIELAEIIIKGYEIEETPEEKLLSIYKNSKENYPGEINYRNGIMMTLNVLNINIKGIND